MAGNPRELRPNEPSLNSVSAGLSLAQQIVEALRAGDPVLLDLRCAQRMTPSFANALVMTVLHALGEPLFSSRLTVQFGENAVKEAWAKAVDRYRRGIRLSTQQPRVA